MPDEGLIDSKMKSIVKAILRRLAPQWTTAWLSARARAHAHRVVASWGCREINAKLIDRYGNRVCEGPFAGLVLPPLTQAEHLGPYLLGVYESELDAAWEVVFRGEYRHIVDIGAKFGYYAVGLARQFPQATIVAFDTDWWARAALGEMASANAVRNLRIEGFCSARWLRNLPDSSALILCDAEGYEAELFGPTVIASLAQCTLVIESHDCFVPRVSQMLRSAFELSHHVYVLDTARPRRGSTLALDFLTAAQRQLALQEVRPEQCWLLCLPRRGPNRGLSCVALEHLALPAYQEPGSTALAKR